MTMLMIREQLAIVSSEKVAKKDDCYWCTRCDAPLTDEVRSGPLWTYGWGVGAGFGKVVAVRRLYCPTCYPDWRPTNEETEEGVYDIQLIDVNEELFPTGLMKDLGVRAMQVIGEHRAKQS